MTSQHTGGAPSNPVAIACAGCGKLHEFPQAAAIEQVWCSGCGELVENKAGIRRKPVTAPPSQATLWISASVPSDRPRRASRPISVQISLLAGGLSVFMEILAGLASSIAAGPMFLLPRILFHPWWIFMLVWVGLLFKSQRAARCATAGGVLVAFVLCNVALRQQIAMWGPPPQWPDLFWGTMRIMLRSLPLLVMVVALGTRSAREYFYPALYE
jgi:hypothetical protein